MRHLGKITAFAALTAAVIGLVSCGDVSYDDIDTTTYSAAFSDDMQKEYTYYDETTGETVALEFTDDNTLTVHATGKDDITRYEYAVSNDGKSGQIVIDGAVYDFTVGETEGDTTKSTITITGVAVSNGALVPSADESDTATFTEGNALSANTWETTGDTGTKVKVGFGSDGTAEVIVGGTKSEGTYAISNESDGTKTGIISVGGESYGFTQDAEGNVTLDAGVNGSGNGLTQTGGDGISLKEVKLDTGYTDHEAGTYTYEVKDEGGNVTGRVTIELDADGNATVTGLGDEDLVAVYGLKTDKSAGQIIIEGDRYNFTLDSTTGTLTLAGTLSGDTLTPNSNGETNDQSPKFLKHTYCDADTSYSGKGDVVIELKTDGKAVVTIGEAKDESATYYFLGANKKQGVITIDGVDYDFTVGDDGAITLDAKVNADGTALEGTTTDSEKLSLVTLDQSYSAKLSADGVYRIYDATEGVVTITLGTDGNAVITGLGDIPLEGICGLDSSDNTKGQVVVDGKKFTFTLSDTDGTCTLEAVIANGELTKPDESSTENNTTVFAKDEYFDNKAEYEGEDSAGNKVLLNFASDGNLTATVGTTDSKGTYYFVGNTQKKSGVVTLGNESYEFTVNDNGSINLGAKVNADGTGLTAVGSGESALTLDSFIPVTFTENSSATGTQVKNTDLYIKNGKLGGNLILGNGDEVAITDIDSPTDDSGTLEVTAGGVTYTLTYTKAADGSLTISKIDGGEWWQVVTFDYSARATGTHVSTATLSIRYPTEERTSIEVKVDLTLGNGEKLTFDFTELTDTDVGDGKVLQLNDTYTLHYDVTVEDPDNNPNQRTVTFNRVKGGEGLNGATDYASLGTLEFSDRTGDKDVSKAEFYLTVYNQLKAHLTLVDGTEIWTEDLDVPTEATESGTIQLTDTYAATYSLTVNSETNSRTIEFKDVTGRQSMTFEEGKTSYSFYVSKGKVADEFRENTEMDEIIIVKIETGTNNKLNIAVGKETKETFYGNNHFKVDNAFTIENGKASLTLRSNDRDGSIASEWTTSEDIIITGTIDENGVFKLETVSPAIVD